MLNVCVIFHEKSNFTLCVIFVYFSLLEIVNVLVLQNSLNIDRKNFAQEIHFESHVS